MHSFWFQVLLIRHFWTVSLVLMAMPLSHLCVKYFLSLFIGMHVLLTYSCCRWWWNLIKNSPKIGLNRHFIVRLAKNKNGYDFSAIDRISIKFVDLIWITKISQQFCPVSSPVSAQLPWHHEIAMVLIFATAQKQFL